MNKSPLLSRTLWVNVLAAIALFVQSQTGYVIDPATQAVLLTAINIILRAVTRQPLAW